MDVLKGNGIRPQLFICWSTFHFQEFQSATIGEKIKIQIETEMYGFVPLSEIIFGLNYLH